MCGNGAQVGLRAGRDVPRGTGIEAHPKKTTPLVTNNQAGYTTTMVDVLRLLQVISLRRTLALEQVTVVRSLLHGHGVDSISLLKDLLIGGPFLDQVGDPRLLAGILYRLVDTVEDEAGGEGTNGDVKTGLYDFRSTVSFVKSRTRYYYSIDTGTQRIGLPIEIKGANAVKPKRENKTISTENTYTEALAHWLGVSSVRSESSRLLVPQQRPHRGHRSPGEEHDL